MLFEKGLDVSLDIRATKQTESVYSILDDIDDNVGEPDVPEWKGSAQLRLKYDDFTFNWETQFIGKGIEDDLTPFDDNPENTRITEGNRGCRGLTIDDGNGGTRPLRCRPVAFTEDYFVHNASLHYSFDNYGISVGVRNVFNDEPPKVDGDGSFSNNNIPLGVGYAEPRSYYLNVTASF